MKHKTSWTDPLRIDAVSLDTGGVIGMTFCLGKHDPSAMSGNWSRDLEADLVAIVDWGATSLVRLLLDHEFDLLRVPDLGSKARSAGLSWYHLPILDSSIPGRPV